MLRPQAFGLRVDRTGLPDGAFRASGPLADDAQGGAI